MFIFLFGSRLKLALDTTSARRVRALEQRSIYFLIFAPEQSSGLLFNIHFYEKYAHRGLCARFVNHGVFRL